MVFKRLRTATPNPPFSGDNALSDTAIAKACEMGFKKQALHPLSCIQT